VLVDTHCHLNFDSFNNDRGAVLERAREAEVERILNPGVDLVTSQAAVKLAESHPEVFAAVGVHPNDALTWDNNTPDQLMELAKHPKVVAIGEIGLDYYRNQAPHDIQKWVFRQQLTLAAEVGLPVVIHMRNTNLQDREATVDVLHILSEWRSELAKVGSPLEDYPGVLHSFSDDEEAARQAIQMNFRIGITGPVTFRNAQVLQHVAGSLPLDRLLIETDAPFLTPHPYRGQRNEPAYVRFVAEKIGQIRSLSYDVVAKATSTNAKRLFNW
jgi:TatD DNase family protein